MRTRLIGTCSSGNETSMLYRTDRYTADYDLDVGGDENSLYVTQTDSLRYTTVAIVMVTQSSP